MGYMDRNQSQERRDKIKKIRKCLDEHGGTIKEISEMLGIPRSTVQRLLHAEEAFSDEESKYVEAYLQSNKEEGRSKGGKNSGYSKDELGRFTGSGKGRCK